MSHGENSQERLNFSQAPLKGAWKDQTDYRTNALEPAKSGGSCFLPPGVQTIFYSPQLPLPKEWHSAPQENYTGEWKPDVSMFFRRAERERKTSRCLQSSEKDKIVLKGTLEMSPLTRGLSDKSLFETSIARHFLLHPNYAFVSLCFIHYPNAI